MIAFCEAVLAEIDADTVVIPGHGALSDRAGLAAYIEPCDHGLLVRDCTSFGLPLHVRIAARLPAENEQLLDTLKNSNLQPDL